MDQFTPVFVVPVTDAVNCWVEPTAVETDVGVKVIATEAGATPVPVRASDRFGAVVELLPICRLPVAVPAVEGAKRILSASVWPEFSVTGNVTGASEKPVPLTAAELIVTGLLPPGARVTVFVDVDPSVTLPNATLVGLTESVDEVTTTCNDVDLLDVPSDAVSVTLPAVAEDPMLTTKVALVAFAATFTEDGSVRAVLLLVSFITTPPAGAALVSPTAHESVLAGPTDDWVQDR